jgi:PAS domain S-box-containing protein
VLGEITASEGGWLTLLIGALSALCGVLGGLLVKFWPVRAKAQRDAAALQAKLKRDAQEQVREEYGELFDRQKEQLQAQQQALERVRTRVEELHAEVIGLHRENTDCLVKNERLLSRIVVLEATLERVQTVQAVGDVPTRNEALVVVDHFGVINQWNEAAVVLFHWAPHEAVGRPVTILVPPEFRAAHDKGWAEVVGPGGRSVRRGPYFLEALTKGGDRIPVEMVLSSWMEKSGHKKVAASLRKRATDASGRTLEDMASGADLRARLDTSGPQPLGFPPGSSHGHPEAPDVIVRADGLSVKVEDGK